MGALLVGAVGRAGAAVAGRPRQAGVAGGVAGRAGLDGALGPVGVESPAGQAVVPGRAVGEAEVPDREERARAFWEKTRTTTRSPVRQASQSQGDEARIGQCDKQMNTIKKPEGTAVGDGYPRAGRLTGLGFIFKIQVASNLVHLVTIH